MSAPGFERAPVSKSLFIVSGVASIAAALVDTRKAWTYGLSWTDLLQRKQVWRLLTSQVIFHPAGEMVLGLILLYSFRVFERMFGSKKFAGSVIVLSVLSLALQLLSLLVIPSARKGIASGMWWLVFGLFASYFKDVPPASRLLVFGLPLSDKSLIYLLGLQLMMANSPSSVWAALCGLLAGILYRSIPMLTRVRPPAALSRLCVRLLGPLAAERSAPAAAAGAGAVGARAGMAALFGGNPGGEYAPIPQQNAPADAAEGVGAAPADAVVVPDEAAVRQLVELGFAEADARRALSQSQNNTAIAINRLAEQQ